jgi:hypothetical protein
MLVAENSFQQDQYFSKIAMVERTPWQGCVVVSARPAAAEILNLMRLNVLRPLFRKRASRDALFHQSELIRHYRSVGSVRCSAPGGGAIIILSASLFKR